MRAEYSRITHTHINHATRNVHARFCVNLLTSLCLAEAFDEAPIVYIATRTIHQKRRYMHAS
jgi:hypothetical protein